MDFPPELLDLVDITHQAVLMEVLSHDPRPSYQKDPDRIYGMRFGGYNVKFQVRDGLLTVTDVTKEA